MSDYVERIRRAPTGPLAESTVYVSWSLQHKKRPGSWVHADPPEGDPRWWFTSWAGKSHRGDDPDLVRKYEIQAHKALDASYNGRGTWTDTRLLREVETHSTVVERVPAMWDTTTGGVA